MKVRIEVTQDDIKAGQRCDSMKCPIAYAARRALGGMVSVGPAHIDSWAGASHRVLPLPCPALAFLTAFDGKKPVEPFSFDIDIPSPLATQDTARLEHHNP